MGSVGVVVVDVVNNEPFELLLVPDDGAVEEFSADGSDPSSEEHLSAGDVDEEQDVVAAEQGGVDGEEVAGHGGLRVQELRPCDVGSFRCWVDATGLEDLPHSGGRDLVAEAGESPWMRR